MSINYVYACSTLTFWHSGMGVSVLTCQALMIMYVPGSLSSLVGVLLSVFPFCNKPFQCTATIVGGSSCHIGAGAGVKQLQTANCRPRCHRSAKINQYLQTRIFQWGCFAYLLLAALEVLVFLHPCVTGVNLLLLAACLL